MTTKHTRNARKPALKKPPSTAELAAALEITGRRVSQLKLAGMPVHSVAAAQAWRRAQSGQDGSAEQLRRERILLIREQRHRVEIENKRVRGELIPRDAVKLSDTKIGCAVRAFSKAVENELPALCLGLPLDRSRPLVRTRMRELQELLADEFSAFWQDYPEADGK